GPRPPAGDGAAPSRAHRGAGRRGQIPSADVVRVQRRGIASDQRSVRWRPRYVPRCGGRAHARNRTGARSDRAQPRTRKSMTRPSRIVLVGHPVSHSLSPTFQNAALRVAGIDISYEALDVAPDALASAMRAFTRARVAGNVTLPHKEAVYALCDHRSAMAARVGAVNTFWSDGTQLFGDNTDVGGFDAAFR